MTDTDLIRNPYQLRALSEEAAKLDGKAEMYTFIPDTDPEGMVFLYVVAFVRRWAEAKSIETIQVLTNPTQAANFCRARDVSPEAAEAVLQHREATGTAEEPIMIANWPGGSQVVFDGSHRLVGHGMRGERTLPAYLIDQDFLMRRGFCRMMSRPLYEMLNAAEQADEKFI